MPRKGHVMMEAEIGERVEAFLHNLLEGSIFFNIYIIQDDEEDVLVLVVS